jgi:DNA-binding CsgD family transcriptional regulator
MGILAEFLDACEGNPDRARLMGALLRVTGQLGIEFFAAAFVPLAHERLDPYFIWDHWPPGWLKRYLTNNYFHIDPVVRALRHTGRSVLWTQSLQRQPLPSKSRRLMDEAKDFGLVDGLTIPLHSKTGISGVFSLAGREMKLTSDEIVLLEIVASRAHGHLLERGAAENALLNEPSITKAESRCLTWCSAGKTDREIAQIEGRSPRTVQAHLYNLQRKLGASNRAQLIAEGFRRGLLR